jgi:hypothetical protein
LSSCFKQQQQQQQALAEVKYKKELAQTGLPDGIFASQKYQFG